MRATQASKVSQNKEGVFHKCKKILTHYRPHADEILGIWLLRKFGEKLFPGVGKAKLVFCGSGEDNPLGQSTEEHEREGTLLVGVGCGRFDEHPPVGGKKKEEECAATLVAKTLGICNEPALRKILQFVTDNDLRSKDGHPFDIACLIGQMHLKHPRDPKMVIDWAIKGFEAKYEEQRQFFMCEAEFKEKAEVEYLKIHGPQGEALHLVTIESDNELVSKFARSDFGVKAAVVIQKRSSGNVQIYSNRKYGIVFYELAKAIRLMEQKKKYGNVIATDTRTLGDEGRVAGAEEWFFHYAGQMLLNGSLTATSVCPTHIPLATIKQMVKEFVSVKKY